MSLFSHHRLALIVGACLLVLGLGTGRADAAGRRFDLRASVSLVPSASSTLHYRGTFTGQPLSKGSVELRCTIEGSGDAVVGFTFKNRRGSVSGSGRATLSYSGRSVTYSGTAKLTSGTGAYRTLRARALRITGRAPISAERVDVRLSGTTS